MGLYLAMCYLCVPVSDPCIISVYMFCRINGNDAGEHLEPTLRFEIFTSANEPVPDDAAIRKGDLVR